MRVKRNNLQMKNENSPEEERNEMEIRNLSDIEFRIMMVKMLKSMRKKYSKYENRNKE